MLVLTNIYDDVDTGQDGTVNIHDGIVNGHDAPDTNGDFCVEFIPPW